jgi:uncharacterized protein YjbJ (UPF0337 family)
MSGSDKASNKVQKVKGKFRAAVGRALGSRELETRGKDAQRMSDLKDAGEKIKDAVRPKGRRQQR